MEHRTEEEQVAALKQWWKDNGNSLIIGVGLALAVVFGWKIEGKETQTRQKEKIRDKDTAKNEKERGKVTNRKSPKTKTC